MSMPILGLGIDAGGTQTRWALANEADEIVADGNAAGMTALQMGTDAGRAHVHMVLASIAGAILPAHRPQRICAGMTGFTDGGDQLRTLIGQAFELDADAVSLKSDIEIACLDLFAPGIGYVVYAGTGSIAAFIDATGEFHRAGGRGAILDDAGGGFWIAIEALRHIWRAEDTRPGAWHESPLAVEMFARLGGSDWTQTKEFVYQRTRGEIGQLALAVASSADRDPISRDILLRAGEELARLAKAMIARYGRRPVALTGRAVQLHSLLEQSMRAALPKDIDLHVRANEAHVAAARIAARMAQPT